MSIWGKKPSNYVVIPQSIVLRPIVLREIYFTIWKLTYQIRIWTEKQTILKGTGMALAVLATLLSIHH